MTVTVNRRRLLASLGAAAVGSIAGCTGGPGDPITMLAVNRDDAAHEVTAWVVRDERLAVANTVDVAGGAVAELGETPWRPGRYRVTVRLDGDPVVAAAFQSDEWFNQLDVVVGRDGSVDLNRGRAA